jgi:hypothetical protein
MNSDSTELSSARPAPEGNPAGDLSSILHVIVCGFEHGGTTLVGELLRQHESLDSGFEGGLLLNASPRAFPDCQPFYRNLLGSWQISDEAGRAACDTDSFAEAYRRLRDASPVLKNKSVKLFDKTPRYMQCLSDVLTRAPSIPVIAIVRDPRAVIWSSFKRHGAGDPDKWARELLPRTLRHTYSYAAGLRKAAHSYGTQRVLIVQYEELCLDTPAIGPQLFDHIGLDSPKNFSTFGKPRYDIVYGQGVEQSYIFEYRNGLPMAVQDRVRDYFSEFNSMFFDRSS